MRKEGVIIGILVFVILFISSVYAACNDSQLIMNISSTTNAHGELYNSKNYNTGICYTIFGTYTGTTPHPSDCSSPVVWLSGTTNAHASTQQSASYNTKVCFGDLSCYNTTTSCDVANGWKNIVNLSSNTNAHLALGSYPVKICCKPTVSPPSIGGANWTNMDWEVINSADLGDTVRLVVKGTNLEGKEINFTIFKDSGWPFRLFDKQISANSGISTTWVANETGTFYFKARPIDNSLPEITSNNLVVGTESNSPPHAKIESPTDQMIFTNGSRIDFNQSSSDEDDEIRYTWNFGDGTDISGASETMINYNTTHQYSALGWQNIVLNVTDKRGLKDEDRISIFIFSLYENGKYVIANITKPVEGQGYYQNVEFDARTSYAFEVYNGNIYCTAGNCPTRTGDGITILNTPNLTGFETMAFNWSFEDNFVKFGLGTNGSLLNRTYGYSNQHFVNLTVIKNVSGQDSRSFFSVVHDPYCYKDNIDPVRWGQGNQNGEITFSFYALLNANDPNPDYNCYREFVANESDHLCCPSFSQNPEHSECRTSDGKCVAGEAPTCKKYQNEDDCISLSNSDDSQTDINDGPNPVTCGSSGVYGDKCTNRTSCSCYWDDETGCNAKWEYKIVTDKGVWYDSTNLPSNIMTVCSADHPIILGSCSFTSSVIDNCNTTKTRTIKVTAHYIPTTQTPPASCRDFDSNVPCASGTLLSFASGLGIIIAIVLLILFYLFIKSKRKKLGKKRK